MPQQRLCHYDENQSHIKRRTWYSILSHMTPTSRSDASGQADCAGHVSLLSQCSISQSKKEGCQVPGCTADLSQEAKRYCSHKRICIKHMQADSLTIVTPQGGSQLHRFCFQCGRLQPLQDFDGNKRTCRVKLGQRRARKRAATEAARQDYEDPATSGTASAADNWDGCEDGELLSTEIEYMPVPPQGYLQQPLLSPLQQGQAAPDFAPVDGVAMQQAGGMSWPCHQQLQLQLSNSMASVSMSSMLSQQQHQHHHQQQQPDTQAGSHYHVANQEQMWVLPSHHLDGLLPHSSSSSALPATAFSAASSLNSPSASGSACFWPSYSAAGVGTPLLQQDQSNRSTAASAAGLLSQQAATNASLGYTQMASINHMPMQQLASGCWQPYGRAAGLDAQPVPEALLKPAALPPQHPNSMIYTPMERQAASLALQERMYASQMAAMPLGIPADHVAAGPAGAAGDAGHTNLLDVPLQHFSNGLATAVSQEGMCWPVFSTQRSTANMQGLPAEHAAAGVCGGMPAGTTPLQALNGASGDGALSGPVTHPSRLPHQFGQGGSSLNGFPPLGACQLYGSTTPAVAAAGMSGSCVTAAPAAAAGPADAYLGSCAVQGLLAGASTMLPPLGGLPGAASAGDGARGMGCVLPAPQGDLMSYDSLTAQLASVEQKLRRLQGSVLAAVAATSAGPFRVA